MSDIKLIIRRAKRGNERNLDLSGMGLMEIPDDIMQLTNLESINLSGNRLTHLRGIEALQDLRQINVQNNNIASLHEEFQELERLESLNMVGNPIVNQNPQLGRVDNNGDGLRDILYDYFSGDGAGQNDAAAYNTAASASMRSNNFAGTTAGMGGSFGNSGGASGFLARSTGGGNANSNDLNDRFDAMEVNDRAGTNPANSGQYETQGAGAASANRGKDWMQFRQTATSGFGGGARPQTASTGNAKVAHLESQLKEEKRQNGALTNQIESLKKEIVKANFASFTQGASEVSTTSGRLPMVPGVREIQMSDIEIADQIGQGGFSVIHKGFLNGTPVAIKKIFDPSITNELLAEIQNEIVMQSILRHPNIALLMGCCPTIPNIVIVYELVDNSLFNMLHMQRTKDIPLPVRVKIGLDCARVYHYMHNLGIVHRDIKSQNVLIDNNYHVKVCDFGLSKFIADLGTGTMQYAGTPNYMAPELFQKRQYNEKVDVFAFGTLLWEIIERNVPHDGFEAGEIRAKVESGEQLRANYSLDQRLLQLINDCRAVQPASRPDFATIVSTLAQVAETIR